ncbi:aldehyde dehydrogenase family protein [Mycobacterium vicinigordonae]|uniref:Putative succinate-semialdehyde dehydrogenase [NADP(+)] 2 n=1 Tax=Mycobacterium vicinigordonae TaxID=1719132 RepID=A0A7D6HUW1_9MYCO|nr:aldehyde dehydrogenase family protein [Mycobacterium vicinigordonae]QLL08012.1 aldehyde dehydrogenase [Mycobacterium vicinigordonae]
MTSTYDVTFATEAELDTAIDELTRGAQRWAVTGLTERITLLKRTQRSIADAADAWAAAAIVAKGIPPGPLEGEEWMSGPYATLCAFGAVIDSLKKIAAGKSPACGLKSRTVPGNRTAFAMLPGDLFEFNLFNGFSAEVWLTPGVSADEARRTAGLGARRSGENGGVGLVLGAGNIAAIGPLDVLYELIAHNRVSVLKLNPTFAGLIAAYEAAFAPLINANLVRIVNGGTEVGQYLTAHPGVSHVHITGSRATHDMIVWGSRTEKDGAPKLGKPITSELGGVSPIIVVPGKWDDADLRYQAEHVATQRFHNCGHNCIGGQVLVVSADWPQKDAFLAEIRRVVEALPQRTLWYPGADKKVAAAALAYPDAERLNGRILLKVDQSTSQEALTTEYFGPVLAHTELPAIGLEFLCAAIEFCNDKLGGNLGASIIVAPDDRKAMGTAFEAAVADLHYGTIGINVWSAIGFLVPALSWGAYPGNTLGDVGSGIGIVHNSRLLTNIERSVVTGPFRPFPRSIAGGEMALSPKPAWFVTARSAKGVAERLTRFAASPGWAKLPGIFNQAFRA